MNTFYIKKTLIVLTICGKTSTQLHIMQTAIAVDGDVFFGRPFN